MPIGTIIVIITVIGIICTMSGCVSNSVSNPASDSESGSTHSSESGSVSDSESNSTSASSTTKASDELIAAVGTHSGEPEAGFNPITGWGYSREPLI